MLFPDGNGFSMKKKQKNNQTTESKTGSALLSQMEFLITCNTEILQVVPYTESGSISTCILRKASEIW